jgi:hypothetical protein
MAKMDYEIQNLIAARDAGTIDEDGKALLAEAGVPADRPVRPLHVIAEDIRDPRLAAKVAAEIKDMRERDDSRETSAEISGMIRVLSMVIGSDEAREYLSSEGVDI